MNLFRDNISIGDTARRNMYAEQQGLGERRAQIQAGRSMAAGNPQDAAATLYGSGQLDAGAAIEDRQAQQEQQAYQRQRVEKNDQDAEIAKRGEALIKVATGLRNIPVEQRKAALDRVLPVFQQMGIDPTPFAALTPDQLSDESLTVFTGQVQEQIKGVVLAPGSQLRNPQTGELMAEAPDRPDYQKLGPGETLIDPRGGQAGGTGGGDPQSFLQSLTQAGVKITSGKRTPERNAAVGGAKNSYHLTGRAADLVPPPGVSMAQLEQQIRASGFPFAEVINEGDHVHVAWKGQGGGQAGPRVIAQGGPKPTSRPATPEEKAAYGIAANVPAQIKPDGSIDTIALPAGQNPASARKDFASLRKEFNQLDEVKNFKDVAASYKQVAGLATKANPTPADDIALTFSFMKMLDPGSVVREGEYALVGRAAGLPDQVIMGLSRIDQGKGLTPEIRKRLVAAARTVLFQRRETYDGVAGQYRQLAADMGVNPDQFAQAPGKWRQKGKSGGGQTVKVDGVSVTVRPKG